MNIALLTAAGSGTRMGLDIPKQFMSIDDIPVIIYTLHAFQIHPEIDAIAVVCLDGWSTILKAYATQYGIDKLRWVFIGDTTNQGSIRNGVLGLRGEGCSENDIILVHDGVRPLVSEDIISNNIKVCRRYGYAVTGLICKEAVMEKEEDMVKSIDIPRERLVLTQTPHTYRLGTLIDIHKFADVHGISNTVASCTLAPLAGIVHQYLVEGNERNGLKLTRPQDVEIFKALIHLKPDGGINKV